MNSLSVKDAVTAIAETLFNEKDIYTMVLLAEGVVRYIRLDTKDLLDQIEQVAAAEPDTKFFLSECEGGLFLP